ncbi:MAG: ATP-binding protein [Succinatimonas sp.]|nr:ATP-binding protein [Succinatimonas sp.]
MDFYQLNARLPDGNSDFTDIISSNFLYVDKTKYIYDLAFKKGQYFLSRPRRFGKSTLISTLEELFKRGVKPYDGHDSYFKGLYIEDKWRDENNYLIMKLDFAELFTDYCSTGLDFENRFVQVLNEFAKQFGISPKENAKVSDAFSNILKNVANKSLVILIDEYDFPLTQNINHPNVFEDIAKSLRSFYQSMKSNSGKYRFVFITGITRYKDTSIFTAGNTIEDVSLYTEYGEIVGYTKDEIRHYFADYLKYSASVRKSKAIEQVTKEDVEDLLNELASMYDGYCFDKRCMTHVYSTWSIISFFKNRFAEFENYWYVNGGLPSILQSYISDVKDQAQDILKSNQVTVDISTFLNPTNLDTMDIRVLLYQTGYLTLDKTDNDIIYLKFPNHEIIDSFKKLYFGRVFKDTDKRAALKARKIDTLTTSRDIVDYFNRILNAVDYEHYPLTPESAVTNSLFMFFNGYGLTHTNVNVHSSKGRADLIIDDEKRRIVCEFKYAKENDNAESLLKEACEQIAAREYGETEPKPQELLKLALVFSEKERKFTLYKEC